jgi:hypothetical protein
MAWYMWLVAFLLLCASQAVAHELTLLDDRRPTPGLRLELTELPATTARASATVKYRLRAFGLPRGVVFGVWARDFGHAFHEVATGFQMDASVDRTLRAFAKVIPYPITAQDGACTVSLELAARRGDRFIASGAGFDPGEEVITESRYAERIIQKRWRISSEGLLPSDIILHGARSTNNSARYAVKGRSCNVVVEYEWGKPKLNRH